MLFNSIDFILFFVAVVLVYYLLPHRWRWILLLIASCIFYAAFIPAYLIILFGIITIDYFAAGVIATSSGRKKKTFLWVSASATCLLLFLFKYFDFISINIGYTAAWVGWNYDLILLKWILPIGLSFHTFQSLSYVFEVYYGRQQPERHFGVYATYVMFFPQLVAGPIERPQNLLPQFKEEHQLRYSNFVSGFRWMLIGYFKKVVIADNLSPYVDEVFQHHESYSGLAILVAAYFFAIQIYCDFSGYSDIAIGTARVLGFRLMKNFRQPYFATSIVDFWRRWHISLSTWFRDYVYIPLGGSRTKSKRRVYYNLFIVFLLSGVWHGAAWTFVIWGLLHWVYMVLYYYSASVRKSIAEKIRLTSVPLLNNGLSWLVTFHLVVLAWIFFRAERVDLAMSMLAKLSITGDNIMHALEIMHAKVFALNGVLPDIKWLFMSIAMFGVVEFMIGYYSKDILLAKKATVLRRTAYYTLLVWILLVGMYDSAPHFIYFQF